MSRWGIRICPPCEGGLHELCIGALCICKQVNQTLHPLVVSSPRARSGLSSYLFLSGFGFLTLALMLFTAFPSLQSSSSNIALLACSLFYLTKAIQTARGEALG